MGQDSLFGGDEEAEAAFEVAIPDTEWDKKTRLNFEREILGLYVSDHPLLGIEHVIAKDTDISVAELMSVAEEDEEDGRRKVRKPGLIAPDATPG
jgi:DNA polymerase-3 subunit alpha